MIELNYLNKIALFNLANLFGTEKVKQKWSQGWFSNTTRKTMYIVQKAHHHRNGIN